MRINLKFKPTIYTGRTKKEVLSKFKHYSWKSSSCGWYHTTLDGKHIVCFNLMKEKAKYRQFRYKTGEKKGMYKESKLIKPKQWKAFVYRFSEKFAKNIGLYIEQKENHFNYKLI
jgi:hypothetical protein